MPELKQNIRFCETRDGLRIAYATMGKGPPLVWGPHFLCHVEFDIRSPLWQPWFAELTRHHTLIRYDHRGCGLSDRSIDDLSLDGYVADLEAVVDSAGLERFALFGSSQGAAISIAYTTRHPERVERLAIFGGFARAVRNRGYPPERLSAMRAMLELVEHGWGSENPAYRQMFTTHFIPDATAEEAGWFNEQERTCTTPELAARLLASFGAIDVSDIAGQVRCPTLVMHLRNDLRVPFEEGRIIAGLIPGARFVPLDGRNHVMLESFPEFRQTFVELHAFLQGGKAGKGERAFPELTERERRIVELLAHGLDNTQIAAHLGIAEKTVRNNITPILDKLGVESRSHAIVRAREAGFAATPLPKSS